MELKMPSNLTEPNDKLAYALRAKRLLIDKNNSKVNDADYEEWHYGVFMPMIKAIGVRISEARKTSTIATLEPLNEQPDFSDEKYDRYLTEQKAMESDKTFDADIIRDNPDINTITAEATRL